MMWNGNDTLPHVLELQRQRGDNFQIAEALRWLCNANRDLGLYEEGIRQAKEALNCYDQISNTKGKLLCLNTLAFLLLSDNQFDAAENAASRAIDIATETGQEYQLSDLHRVLGNIYRSKGEKEKAIHHYKTALEIASRFSSHALLFWTHYALVQLFYDAHDIDNATAHIELAKLHAANDPYKLGRAMELQTIVWYWQSRLEDAKLEALHTLGIYEKLGAGVDARRCRDLLQSIEQKMKKQSTGFEVSFWRGFYILCLLTSTS